MLAASASGCLGSITGGADRYAGYTRVDLIPGIDVFPDDWREYPGMNDDYDVYGNADETIFVGFDARVFDGDEDVDEEWETLQQKYRDPQEYDLAGEAFWAEYQDEVAVVFFRHSNAFGSTFAVRQSGLEAVPDRGRALDYAEVQFEHWRDLE